MIELYHADMSTCAQKVRLTLADKGLYSIVIPAATFLQIHVPAYAGIKFAKESQ